MTHEEFYWDMQEFGFDLLLDDAYDVSALPETLQDAWAVARRAVITLNEQVCLIEDELIKEGTLVFDESVEEE